MKLQNQKFFVSVLKKWQTILVIASLLVIVAHFILKQFSNPQSQQLADYLFFVNIAIGGAPLLYQIIGKIFKGDFGADLLAAIAFLTAIYLQQYLTAILLIIMLASGQALELYAMRKASLVLEALASRMSNNAHKKSQDKIIDITLDEIKIGDEIMIYPHESCPVDGIVIDGHGTMDESYLTGEPYKISKAPGTKVLSGAINGESTITIRAEKLAQDSRYSKIIKVMEDAEKRRPKMMRLADQIGTVFTPIAMFFALTAWFFSGDLTRFLAVLTVATPCPLLIAIPVTIISAISLSAKRSIIIRDPAVLELLPTCKIAIFDKTGTLTYGQPELTAILSDFPKQEILQKVASIERYSRHPLAYAILKAAQKSDINLLEAQNVSEISGQGLSGVINGEKILITGRNKLLVKHPEMESLLPQASIGLECIILINDNYAATLQLRDTLRDDGHSFISHLAPEHDFKEIILLSGDRKSEVEYLAQLLEIKQTLASQSPEQKLEFVREKTAKAPTLFMGDGINDAPALAAATVGLAFGQHNSVTSEAAGAVIMENTLTKVDELFHISERMRKIALQSAVGGMLVSIVGIILAAIGLITPLTGAIAQELIDVFAILNALRMTWDSKIESDLG